MKIEDGGPAFPSPIPDDLLNKQGNNIVVFAGMTMRDYFAGQALNGSLSVDIQGGNYDYPHLAEQAYRYADAMIAQRSKHEN